MTRVVLLASLLFVGVIASRAPFAATTLWAHDSVLYANAIERGFHVDDDPTQQRPHPPGYVLYVASAATARAAGLPTNTALVAISALASALTAVGLYLFLRRRVRSAVAAIVAAAYATNPLVWEYSEIAYPYTLLGLASFAVGAACLWARGGGTTRALVASVCFGIAGGFRQDVLLLLLPLWTCTVAPLGRGRASLAGATVLAASAVWLVPTITLSGGPAAYLEALTAQASYVGDSYSVAAQGVPAFAGNLAATSWSVGWGLFVMLPFSVAAVAAAAVRLGRTRQLDDTSVVLLWTLPALALYVVLHIGDWGYVLSALPGLYVLGATALDRVLAASTASHGASRVSLASLAVVVAPALVFVLAPAPFSAAAITEHDAALSARVAYVSDNYAPQTTLILTREDYLLVRYYLPEYRVRQYDPEPFTHASRRMRARGVDRVVVFTDGLRPERAGDVRRVACKKGVEFVYLDVIPGSILEFRGERYAIALTRDQTDR